MRLADLLSSTAPRPYRVLFPLGVLFGLLGAALWPLHAAGWAPYSGPLHSALMIQGFEHCFILGFFLTAMPAFTHGEKCRWIELVVATLGVLGFGVLALAGLSRGAEIAYAITVALLAIAAARRLRASRFEPPEEFVFVLLGLALGLAGSVTLAATADPWFVEAAPRLGMRLVSLGMVLSLVLGFGGLLMPTFTMMRDPLVIPGIAKAGERAPRRALYRPLAILLIGAFVAEFLDRPALGAWLRAGVATVIGLLVWKLFRPPGRRDLLSFSLWGSGWFVLAGLWMAALVPRHASGGLHLTLMGGFALLTLGISTRVVVSHGGFVFERERKVLSPVVVGALGLALASRLAAEFAAPFHSFLLGASGALWIAAWLFWIAAAGPLILARRRAVLVPVPGPVEPAGGGAARKAESD